ncbi:type II toxin-antitoxin system HipA family toxin [Mycolicibacterium hippocampi]|uniref:Protein kinase n=1 Tax=Mycolicibacterium hippocampi TaxID=659824 RepID=A0A850PNL3_9MYCO|nr:type II toxin-antitoxin system HipA family toxin [Mycolicibacterium hippocampi]NVN50267.1 hypothetical protein [Mycolicibacterium hippocampi]
MTVTNADLRTVTEGDVYLGHELVARLARDDSDLVSFDYVSDVPLDDRRLRDQSVAWSLLRSAEYPIITNGGAVPAFFAGLLPEGVRLGVVTSSTKTSADDHLTLLLAIGGDTIGNVRVLPSGMTADRPPPMFDPQRDNDFHAVFGRLTGSLRNDPVGMPGVQPKVSAAMVSAPARTPTGHAILKLNPQQYPLLVENEHFFMTMAHACGIRTAATSLLHDVNGRSALLVKRFDRLGDNTIAQEDACQVAGLYPASKYRIKAETAISSLADACALGGGARAVSILELLRIVVFSWLIGNGDLHGKNLSIFNPDGIWQPTPAYDLLTTQPYTGWRDPMALNLYGRANRFDRQHFVEAGERLGVRSRAVARMIDAIVDAARPWSDRCGDIGFDARQTERLAKLLRDRAAGLSPNS